MEIDETKYYNSPKSGYILRKETKQITPVECQARKKCIFYGMLLKKIREEKGISKKEMRISLSLLELIEDGKKEATGDTLCTMLNVLFSK